ncbi:MAG: HypC/HybG/HupF family hydrogenase formation chaperone [archaeon]|nr:MAG: HypC/HybG/HupF family hydrogenase formation chaperone [archaeon]
MCLAVPAKVVKLENDRVLVDALGEKSRARLNPSQKNKPSVGDYVLVQAGMVTEILDKKAAIQSLDAWKDILRNAQR